MDTLLVERNNRVCSYCQVERPIEAFPWRVKSKNLRDGRCMECKAAWRAEHYSNNREAIIEKNRRLEKARWEQARQIVETAKAVPCMDCGNSFPTVCMDFDHRDPGTKFMNVSYMTWHHSIETLLAEIAKCDVVCSNCHRIRTLGDM